MGHDVHFLDRLGRVSDGHVSLAMSLYKDPALVREIFARSELPDGAARVALSLADPVDGPFVLLERGGRFVTCLGPGMRTSDVPIITRQKLDSVASQLAILRERLELVRHVTTGEKEPDSHPVWTRLLKQPTRLTREDVAGLGAWMPILAGSLAWSVARFRPKIEQMRELLRDRHGPGPVDRDLLREKLGDALVATTTCVQLLFADPDFLARAYAPEAEPTLLLTDIIDWRDTSLVLRALNGLARGGKFHVASLKRSNPDHFAVCSGLGAIACAHPKLEAELRKVLARAGDVLENFFMDRVLDRREEMRTSHLEHGRTLAFESTARGVRQPVYASPAEVPDHVSVAVMADPSGDLRDEKTREYLLLKLPLIAGAKPEDLYYPAEFLPHVDQLAPAEMADRYLERWGADHRREPVRAEPKPERNAPCPCGSGRKYKKCCAAG